MKFLKEKEKQRFSLRKYKAYGLSSALLGLTFVGGNVLSQNNLSVLAYTRSVPGTVEYVYEDGTTSTSTVAGVATYSDSDGSFMHWELNAPVPSGYRPLGNTSFIAQYEGSMGVRLTVVVVNIPVVLDMWLMII